MKKVYRVLLGILLYSITWSQGIAQQVGKTLDINSPELELLKDNEIICFLDEHFQSEMPKLKKIERATQVLYNVKSERVRNVYVMHILRSELESGGYQVELKGLFEDIELCSKTEATRQEAKVLKERYYLVRTGSAAPDFDMEDENGKRIKLSDYVGKIVFIQVYDENYGDHIHQMKCFIALGEKMKKQEELVLISIMVGRNMTVASWKSALEDIHYSGKITNLIADKEQFVEKYCITRCPRYILIDKTGKIVNAWHVGPDFELFSMLFQHELRSLKN